MAHSTTDSLSAASPTATAEDYRWLADSGTAELLSTVAGWREPLTAQVAQLRRQLSATRTHLVLEQVALRQRAREKFAAADRMFFTPRTLEQASDEIVAAYKAARFAGRARTFDLCSGIGGDLLAIARVSEATGVDRDPIMAVVAEANGRLVADEGKHACPTVRVCDVEQVDVGESGAWHIDPDRRPRGRRTTRVELHEPGVEVLDRLLLRNRNAAIKLAPAAEVPEAWLAEAELEWISRARQCRQLVAWFDELASQAGHRRATILAAGPTPAATIVGLPCREPPASGRVDAYVFEPDAAVLAADLGGMLAGRHGLAPIAPGIAYWTGPGPIDEPAIACFEVQETLGFDLKRLTALLRARRIGQLEIKKRGVEQDPEKLRRQLALAGDESATLLLTKVNGRVTAILARRARATS